MRGHPDGQGPPGHLTGARVSECTGTLRQRMSHRCIDLGDRGGEQEADRAEQTDTRPRPQRVQEPAREDRLSGRLINTVPSGSRQATGSKNRRLATRHDVGGVLATGEAFSRPAHHKVGTKPRRSKATNAMS